MPRPSVRLIAPILVFLTQTCGYANCIASPLSLTGPYIDWIHNHGSLDSDIPEDVAIDSNGDLVVTGWTFGTLGSEHIGPIGSPNIFISKYDQAGTRRWTKQIGLGRGDRAFAMSTSALGTFYVAGTTAGGSGIEPNGNSAAILSKFNSDGEVIWSRMEEMYADNYATDVFADEYGNVVLTTDSGNYSSEFNYRRTSLVSKYDTDGHLAWRQTFEIDGMEAYVQGVTSDSSGDIYVTGRASTASFFHYASNAILAKYSTDGELLWYRDFGTDQLEFGEDVAVDHEGNIYVAGTTQGSLDRPITGVGYRRVDTFVRKFDPSGNEIWTQQIGLDQRDYVDEIAIDADGSVFIAGFTEGRVADSAASYGGTDPYLAKLEVDGSVAWVKQIGSSASDWGKGLAIDHRGSAFITGTTNGNFGGEHLGLVNTSNAFLARIVEPVPEPASVGAMAAVLLGFFLASFSRSKHLVGEPVGWCMGTRANAASADGTTHPTKRP